MSVAANQRIPLYYFDFDVPNAGFVIVRTISTSNNTALILFYHADLLVRNGTFYEYPIAKYDYFNNVTLESYQQDNVFPVLPLQHTEISIGIGNTNTVEDANVTVSIAYCY